MSVDKFDSSQPLHVRLYGRVGCHLCSEAAQVLSSMHEAFDFWVEKIDIDTDPAIREKLNDHIPVVTVDGGPRVTAPVTKEKMRRAFRKALAIEESEHEQETATA